MIVMTRYALDVVSYAPLYLHSFRPVQPHTLVEAEKFNLISTDPTQIDNIADKLRWYQYQHGLLQRDGPAAPDDPTGWVSRMVHRKHRSRTEYADMDQTEEHRVA